ncbi:ATP-binding protein [Methylophilus aquaticus]|uniref:histidine kinase n=1 Tax=Methylophilus aquaticus TaxID=1971610 RepID=A0ABT9JWF7_9PROT|nr:ATP-binding protein [Methylophilus aquaticus]MDP8568390.1 ATP-binding protein [Methylophilus aquaticus]
MRKYLSTMSVRLFLIVIMGVLLTAAIVNLLGQRDFRANESRMREQFAFERVENIIRILEATLPEKRTEIQDVFARMGSRVTLNASPPEQPAALPAELASLQGLMVPEIADQLAFSSECGPRRGMRPPPRPSDHGLFSAPPPPGMGEPPEFEPHRMHGQCLGIYTHLDDGTQVLIHLHYGRRPMPPQNEHQPFLPVLVLLSLVVITWIVASVATKPLRKLANAALRLARNIEHPPLPENEGPVEVRNAAKAFNEMQRSIVKHVQERAFILGAIAHDLQTPLTRLRLRLEKVKEPALKQSLINDLTATQEMVKEGLDFARLCSENIHKSNIDLSALANAICDDFDEEGHHVSRSLPAKAIVMQGSPHLLRRCLTNLLSNAITYAQHPSLAIEHHGAHVHCIISDDGPGIPDTELESMLEPFRRIEDSRSRHTGGSGLGLAIARMIVEKHGGQLRLSNKPSPAHGLVITIEMPIIL